MADTGIRLPRGERGVPSSIGASCTGPGLWGTETMSTARTRAAAGFLSRLLPALLLTLGLTGPALADAGDAPADQAKIDDALRRAVDRLWQDRNDDASWDYGDNSRNRELGMTALALLALYENAQFRDERFAESLQWVRDNALANKDTYSVSLALVLLARVGKRQDRGLVFSLAKKLIAGQKSTGAWHYDVPVLKRSAERDRGSRPARKGGMGDLSVTQFAVLALWQAEQAGVDVEDSLQRVRERLAWGQLDSGGWSYPGTPYDDERNTMTTAGAFMWVTSSAHMVNDARDSGRGKVSAPKYADAGVYEDLRGEIDKRNTQADEDEKSDEWSWRDRLPPEIDVGAASPLLDDPYLQKALGRVDHYARNLKGGGSYRIYYLWSVERLGVLLGFDRFGKTDWFAQGSRLLVESQREDGSWGPERDAEGHYLYGPDTCFAMLFLRRANLGSAVTRMIVAPPPRPFEIVRTRETHDTLAAAVAAAQPEDVIAVSGDGPFPLGKVAIDKPVKVRAARGYVPTFRYERPLDDLGLPVRVDGSDPDATTMLLVRSGPVEFEGLRLELDTIPNAPADTPWAVMRVRDGGQVRLLNCMLSSAKGEPAGVVLEGGQSGFLRNCFLNGCSPAIAVRPSETTPVMVHNCLVHARTALAVGGAGTANLLLVESTVQAEDVLALDGGGAVHVAAEGSLLVGETLVAGDGASLTWDGFANGYDVRQWATAGRGAGARDLDDWSRLVRSDEIRSEEGDAPFALNRDRIRSFRHKDTPGKWELDLDRLGQFMTLEPGQQLGAEIFRVGAGRGYVQFADDADYQNWLQVEFPRDR